MLIPVNDFNIAPLNCVRYVPHMLREWRFPILAFFLQLLSFPQRRVGNTYNHSFCICGDSVMEVPDIAVSLNVVEVGVQL